MTASAYPHKPMNAHQNAPRNSGFNLIEAAIVLGVVGLIIGGIWVAASAVSESKRISDTLAGTAQLVQNLRAQYANVDLNAQFADNPYFTADSSVFKNVIGFTYTDTFNVKDAWGQDVGGTFATNGFVLLFYHLNKAACYRLVNHFGGMSDQLTSLQTPDGVFNTLPHTATSADCPNDDVRVELSFKR